MIALSTKSVSGLSGFGRTEQGGAPVAFTWPSLLAIGWLRDRVMEQSFCSTKEKKELAHMISLEQDGRMEKGLHELAQRCHSTVQVNPPAPSCIIQKQLPMYKVNPRVVRKYSPMNRRLPEGTAQQDYDYLFKILLLGSR